MGVHVIWAFLSEIKNHDSLLSFGTLSTVARLVLVILHSNAPEERVFSLIKQNKTPSQSNLKANGTLSSIVQAKLASGSL